MDLPWDVQTEGSIQAEVITSMPMVLSVSIVTVLSWCNKYLFFYSPGIFGWGCCLFTPLPQGIPFVFRPIIVKEQLDLFSAICIPSLIHHHDEYLQFCQVCLHWIVGIFLFHQHLYGFPSFLSILHICPFSRLDRMNLFSFFGIFPKDDFQWNADLILDSSNGDTGVRWEVTVGFPRVVMGNSSISPSLLMCLIPSVTHWIYKAAPAISP